jgi:hypothetical protein
MRFERVGSIIDLDIDKKICRKIYRGPFAEERAFDERTALEVCRRVGLLAPKALRSAHGSAPWLEMTLENGSDWEGHVAESPREYVNSAGSYIKRLHELFRPDSPGFGWLPSRQDIFAGSADFLLFLVRDQMLSLPEHINSGLVHLISEACRDAPLVPLHRDVKPEHVLRAEATSIRPENTPMGSSSNNSTCMIDWEYSSRGPAFYDWAMLTWRAWRDICSTIQCPGIENASADTLVSAVLEVSDLPQEQLAVGVARAALVWAQHRGSAEFVVATRCCTAALDGASLAAILEISKLS